MGDSALKLHAADEVYRLASWNEVVVLDLYSLLTPDRIEQLENIVRAVARRESKATPLARLHTSLGLPPADTRRELTRMLRALDPLTHGWVIVLAGDGFWAAAQRSFSATLHLLSGSRTRMRFFKTDQEAASFVVHLCGRHHPLDIIELLRAVEHS
jgi:hypothetical protein